jgi:hypothetical protein
MRWSRIAIAAVALLSLIAALRADIPSPRPRPQPKPPAIESNLVIIVDPNAKEPLIILPDTVEAPKGANAAPGNDGLTDNGPERSWPRTVFAGLSLAAMVTCGGLWLARRGRAPNRGAAMLLALSLVLSGSALLWANAGPPRPKPQEPSLPELYSGKVKVEHIDKGSTIRLILPPDVAKKLSSSTNDNATGSAPPKSQPAQKPE